MSNGQDKTVFHFNLYVENEDGTEIEIDKGNALLDHILEWVESHGCQMGGGYRYPDKEDTDALGYRLATVDNEQRVISSGQVIDQEKLTFREKLKIIYTLMK